MVKLFVLGFPKGKEDEWFVEIFSKHGQVIEVAMVKSENILKNLGYGFITMEAEESAAQTINALHGRMMEGHLITIRLA